MPRSDAKVLGKNEANFHEHDDEPGPVIVPIHKAERTFRWLSGIRNEPKFELAPVGGEPDGDGPRAA
jgi:hypothetical protein